MNSISEECLVHKQKYDACFNSWFKDKFLKGVKGDSCAGIFKAYQRCVKNAIQEKGIPLDALEEDVLGTAKEKQPKGAATNNT